MELLHTSLDLTVIPFRDNVNPKRVQVAIDMEIGRMPRGTKEGHASVMIKGKLADGTFVLMETTLALLRTAVKAMDIAEQADKDSPQGC